MPSEPGRGSRGASDTVGVVLLVAVSIVLAAMVSTVVLDMGQDRENGLAGASVDYQESSDAVRVVYTNMQRPETTIEVTVTNESNGSAVGSTVLTRVGQSVTFDAGVADGHTYEVVVVADWRDRRTVVLTSRGTV